MKQHFVPQCYLKAWRDPATPKGYDPYVWRFTKDGKHVKKTAPKKIFRETDMYTITMPDGTKDYRLERELHDLEDHFVRLRDTKLKKQKEVTIEEHGLLLAFIAAMHNRSKVQRDHHREQWGRLLDTADKMAQWAKTATPEQKRAAASMSLPRDGKDSGLTHDDIRKLALEPMQQLLPALVKTEVPLLFKLNTAILNTDTSPGFITSDRPCMWFDPKAHLRPPFYRAPALMYPTIEITLPISPSQMCLLNRAGIEGYIDVPASVVDDLNRRNRFHADEYFVVNQNMTKTIWFAVGTEPEDAWERTHRRKAGKPTNA